MVLAELGGRLTAAVRAMASAPVVNEETLNEMLKEIGMLFFSIFTKQAQQVILPSFHAPFNNKGKV